MKIRVWPKKVTSTVAASPITAATETAASSHESEDPAARTASAIGSATSSRRYSTMPVMTVAVKT